jgi:hypothetical protein
VFEFSAPAIAYIFCGLLAAIIICLVLFKRRETYPYYARQELLTAAELQFFHVLIAVTKNKYHVNCKVRLADIINCSTYHWRKGYGYKISSKHIDFVLSDPDSAAIILCIELDDKSHDLPARKSRDKFVNKALNKAGVPFLRLPVTRGYDMGKLEKDIVLALQ